MILQMQRTKRYHLSVILVLQRVAYFRVRVGSGYDYLGYGSGKGIALSFKPGTRVPSGNRRVVRLSKKCENVPH